MALLPVAVRPWTTMEGTAGYEGYFFVSYNSELQELGASVRRGDMRAVKSGAVGTDILH